jgi:hypothetical protein
MMLMKVYTVKGSLTHRLLKQGKWKSNSILFFVFAMVRYLLFSIGKLYI